MAGFILLTPIRLGRLRDFMECRSFKATKTSERKNSIVKIILNDNRTHRRLVVSLYDASTYLRVTACYRPLITNKRRVFSSALLVNGIR